MPESNVVTRQRQALREMMRLASERGRAEAEADRKRTTRDRDADLEFERQGQELRTRHEALTATVGREDEERRRAIVEAATRGEAEAKAVFAKASRKIATDFEAAREQAKTDYMHSKWEANTIFEAASKSAAGKFGEAKHRIDEAEAIHEDMKSRLEILQADYAKFGLDPNPPEPAPDPSKADDPIGRLYDRLAKAQPDLEMLEELVIPKALKGWRDLWVFVLVFLILAYPLAVAAGTTIGLGAAAVLAIVVGFVLRSWLHGVAGRQVRRHHEPLKQAIVDAEVQIAQCRTWADDRLRARGDEIRARRDGDIQKAKKKQAQAIEQAEALRDESLRKANETFTTKVSDAQSRRHRDTKAAIEDRERRLAAGRAEFDTAVRDLEQRYRSMKASIASRFDAAWSELAERWHSGMARAQATLDEVEQLARDVAPGWDDPIWANRPDPKEVPAVIPIGRATVALDDIPTGRPSDPRLMESIAESFRFPAFLTFPERANLLVEATGEGNGAAVAVLQAAMTRLLTSLPPGKVRFTIIDPVGMGRNFAAFMHLADFDEQLVSGRIWTENQQIEKQLADLSAHMEKVIQKYLRNEYETILEYNARADEVAEPFRVLVIADFPTNFDEASARRLARIANEGIRCGVLTLVAVDTEKELPPGIALDELRRNALVLVWDGSKIVWKDEDFGVYPLELDPPPSDEFLNRALNHVGSAAKIASRVEVPFEFIAPPDGWWLGDSRAGIDIALGKAGATKQQFLRLGKGTSQHVLIAGRTGSGKSTLLHALITNLALTYSPDEVELYLIDFKKGVEFKTYATHELPHAKVVAIESEREFGLSVLQRLDLELKHRADLFRDAGVQDLKGYRDAEPTKPLPRVLLIVDEFQEFFVEDDKVAQEASLLLDRLVRQGRAFGVHVHLGSQTLSGAYSLARSTLGQMAVRIALQCSEADAHMVLSEDNGAARLLSRPGEAVYNDANGMAEGNHFFQVVWLTDERREGYLKRIKALSDQRRPKLARTPIVFEGNLPAVLAKNPLLEQRLSTRGRPKAVRSAHAWLGEAVAIKDPTSVVFRRQGANHLLIVGQNEEAALGIMAAALASLAAQHGPGESEGTRDGARFYVLDGTPEDSSLADRLGRVAEALPHVTTVGGWRDAGRIVGELAEEVERRQQPDGGDGPELYLFIHDLQRFRDLRKREDDFSFSRREEAASPADQLSTILRDGSGVGVHVLAWCDSLNNLNRTFDRGSLREFESRVLFQMSAADSSHLIDSPAATRLGPHRAYLSSEEQGRLEKFRPYGLPSDEWLDSVREQFRERGVEVMT